MILQPNCKGTYALILYLSSRCSLRVGRLGIHEFNRGYYLYVGSAFGSGGLAARIRHHVQPSDRPHWHIDYLRSVSILKGVWVICSDFGADVRLEHPWAGVIERMPDARTPVIGFGSTDCRCPTHLFYFMRRLRLNLFQEALSENEIAAQIRQLKDFSMQGIDKPVLLG
jgi:Uri superfamily endonuclease